MMRIQLPTGKTAYVDSGWWLGLSDSEIQAFYERDHGSEIDPLSVPLPTVTVDESADRLSIDE